MQYFAFMRKRFDLSIEKLFVGCFIMMFNIGGTVENYRIQKKRRNKNHNL
jgi:hypothetical protein